MQDALSIIKDNLESWSLGFLCGWAVRNVVHSLWSKRKHRHAATHTNGDPTVTDKRRYTLLGGLITILVAVVVAAIVYAADTYTEGAEDLWNLCRDINYPLGCVVAAAVVYRIVLMAHDKSRWHDPRVVHLLFWFGYVAANLLAASMSSHHYDLLGADANWVSGFRTILMLWGLVLTVWWPHPDKFLPTGGHSR